MAELGRYTLRNEVGSGPYSVVYDAVEGEQRLAVRVLNEDAVPVDPGRRAGLIRALEGLKDIQHASIVKVLDAGEQDGRIFVAMEFLTSPTLREKLDQESSLPEQQVVLFTRQVAQALDRAQEAGYCHGDLRPEHVFVLSAERVKVGAFAIKGLIENPPDAADLPEARGTAQAEEEEADWLTAEDLLTSRRAATLGGTQEEDFVGLAALMLEMLGLEVPARAREQSLDAYRDALKDGPYKEIADPAAGVGTHTAEIVRRLLTPDGFNSPGEIVVELASAMLLARTAGRSRPAPATAQAPSAPGLETQQMSAATMAAASESVEGEEAVVSGGPYTAFFVWTDRRHGRFFVVQDGETLVIGRDADSADVVVRDPAVSRKHLEVSREGGVVRVKDLGSTNGTFVNGQRVTEATLKPTDILRIGTTHLYLSLETHGG